MKVYLAVFSCLECMNLTSLLSYAGFVLVFIGIAITLTALISLVFRSFDEAEETKGGGIILIGPFPIVFGTDRKTVKSLIILAIALIVIVVGFILALNFLET